MRLAMVLALLSMNYGIGCECLPRQIPTHDDAGEDAGEDAGQDAGAPEDAGLRDGGSLAVLVPSGVEVWAGGHNQTVSWTGNTTSRSTLELSLDDGATWSPVATDVPGSTFDWLVPMVDSEQCVIRVTLDGATARSARFVIDSTAPVVTVLKPNAGAQLLPGTMDSTSWTATDRALAALPITLEASSNGGTSWTLLASAEANDGDALFAVPATETSSGRVRVSATDVAGNVGSATSSDFVVDATPPVFTPARFSINGGAATTNSLFVRVAFEVRDDGSPVSAYCLKYDTNTQPSANDPCWQAITPTPLFTGAIDFRLGFAPRAYPVFAWARNTAGFTTSLSGTGTDSASITFTPVTPPDVTRVVGSSIANGYGSTLPAGSTVFIRWRATSTGTLTAAPISLAYTTDDVTFTPIASNVPNAQGTGCVLVGADTGCFTWTTGSPTSAYFRVRVGAVDTNQRQTWRSSSPLNVDTVLRVLAGSTDPGTDGSAEAAVFIAQNVTTPYPAANSLLVSESGVVYFHDINRGLLKVDPSDGVQRIVLRRTGVLTDGPAATATLRRPVRIAFDAQGRVLIFDANVIRRYDPVANNVITLIGGGTDSTSPTVAPRALSISSPSPQVVSLLFFATPDGKLYFQDKGTNNTLTPGTGFGLRVYDPAANAGAGEVRTLSFSGIGDGVNPTQDISVCQGFDMGASYDRATSALTSVVLGLGHRTPGCPDPNNDTAYSVLNPTTLTPSAPHPGNYDDYGTFAVGGNGTLYTFSRRGSIIQRFDLATHSFVTVVGSGINGTCADGTPALACNLDVSDVTATRSGQLYFVDRGRIRTVDQAGAVYTLMGASLTAGDGLESAYARIGSPFDVKVWSNAGTPTVVFFDATQFRIREFPIGGVIQTIAGTGSHGTPSLTAPAVSQPLSYADNGTLNELYFQVHPTLGTLFSSRAPPFFSKLDRATGLWVDLAGGGATPYYATTDALGLSVNFTSSYSPKAIGFDGANKLLLQKFRYNNNRAEDSFLENFDLSTNHLTQLAGVTGAADVFMCADGTPRASCAMSYVRSGAAWDATGSRWLVLNPGEPTLVRAVSPTSVALSTVVTLSTPVVSIALNRGAAVNKLYFCRDTGVLGVYDFMTSTESTLPWPIARMKCTGRNLVWVPTRNTVVFPFTIDGVGGIAEYVQ